LNSSLLFDFDGTIADTLAEGLAIYDDIALEEGYRKIGPQDLAELRALDTTKLFKHLGIPKHKIPFLIAKALSRIKARISELPLIEGMEEVLPQLRKHANCFGILTSNAVENVEAFLEAHGLRDLFTFISTTSKLTGKDKHLRSIARTFSLRKEEMFYIGDEIRDLRAARKARIDAIAVTWGLNNEQSLAKEEPRYLVHTPAELLEVVANHS
jgi:HAD superfamily hydrolase (TIGR01549 family)